MYFGNAAPLGALSSVLIDLVFTSCVQSASLGSTFYSRICVFSLLLLFCPEQTPSIKSPLLICAGLCYRKGQVMTGESISEWLKSF